MDLALAPPRRPAAETLDAVEQDAIERALRAAGGNRSRAARQLGISRTSCTGGFVDIDSKGRVVMPRWGVPGVLVASA